MIHKRTKYRRNNAKNNAKNTHKLRNRRKYTKKYRGGGNGNSSGSGSVDETHSESGFGEIYPIDVIPPNTGIALEYQDNPMHPTGDLIDPGVNPRKRDFFSIVLSDKSTEMDLKQLYFHPVDKFTPTTILSGGKSGALLIEFIHPDYDTVIMKIYTPRALPYTNDDLEEDLAAHEKNPFSVAFLRGLTDIFNNVRLSQDTVAKKFLPETYGYGLMHSTNITQINPSLMDFLSENKAKVDGKVIDLSEKSNLYYPYLVMEKLPGRPLYETIGSNVSSIVNPMLNAFWYRIVWIFILYRIAFIMDYLRKNFGFCHRDLHPNNIYISFAYELKEFFDTSLIITDQNFIENFLKVLGITDEITTVKFCKKMEELIFVRIIDFDLSKMSLSKMSLSKMNASQDVENAFSRELSNGCTRKFYTDSRNSGRSVIRGELITATLEFREKVLKISRYDSLPPAMENDADLYAWGQLYTAFLEQTSQEKTDKLIGIKDFKGCEAIMIQEIYKEISLLNREQQVIAAANYRKQQQLIAAANYRKQQQLIAAAATTTTTAATTTTEESEAKANYRKQQQAASQNLDGEPLQDQSSPLSTARPIVKPTNQSSPLPTTARPIVKSTIPSSSQWTREELLHKGNARPFIPRNTRRIRKTIYSTKYTKDTPLKL